MRPDPAGPERPDKIVGNPVHRLFSIYIAIAGAALLFPNRRHGWAELLIMHVMIVALLWPLPPFAQGWKVIGSKFPRLLRYPFDWLPILTVPLLYTELATLNLMVHAGRFFDPLIIAVERAVFGMPSTSLARTFDVLWLSELLHAGYLSYYFILFMPPLVLYALGRHTQFRRVVFTVLLSFFAHYLFFVYFPVQGPRYLFPAPDGDVSNGVLYKLTHVLLEAGSSRGAAFPSSHVGASVAMTLAVARVSRRGGYILGIATVLLAFGAVYGGFHYATDAVAGFMLGTLCVFLAPRAFELLGGSWDSPATRDT